MRWLGIILLSAIFAQAGVTDFLTLHQAKKAYADKQYEKAAEAYGKIAAEGNEEALFDQADALYKAGRYEEALKKFQAVKSPKLRFDKLYNSGNCYAHLGKIDEAIKAYEEALKIEEDKNARYNLELLKKLKKREQQQKQKQKQKQQQKKKPSQSKDQQKKKEGKQQQGNGKQKQDKSGSKKSKQGKSGKDEQSKKQKQQSGKKQKQGDKKKESKEMTKAQKQKDEAMRAKTQKKVPISDMEVRKWNRVLNQRGIPTLMLPLPTEKNGKRSPDETKPW